MLANKSNGNNEGKIAPEDTSSITHEGNAVVPDMPPDQSQWRTKADYVRASSKSKREIMEELHRQRFPWEE